VHLFINTGLFLNLFKLSPADESLAQRQPFLGQGMQTVSQQMEAASKQTHGELWLRDAVEYSAQGRGQGGYSKGGTDRDEGQTTSFTWLEWAGGEVWRRRRPLLNVNVECGLTVGSSYTQAPSAAPSHPTHDHPLTNCKLNRHRKPEKDRQRRRLLT